jgi:hypothetical protein
MALLERESVLSALGARSPHWIRWIRFVDMNVPKGKVPNGDVTVHMLRSYLQAESISGVKFLKNIRENFEIEKQKGSGLHDEPRSGQGWVKISRRNQELFGHDVVIGVGAAAPQRRFSVEAHEIAHLFHAALVERAVGPNTIQAKRSNEAERFCWEFALGVFCPRNERVKWNSTYIAEFLNPDDKKLVAQLESEKLHRLSYWHIRALARHYNISIRMVIAALDHHLLLNEVCCGIGIFKRMPNPATSSEIALRVWQRACPQWGYLPNFQRITKQGFDSADRVYSHQNDQETVVFHERLRLRFASQKGSVKWPMRTVDTVCAYTPVDVISEGRYLFAIWQWEKKEY